MSRILFILLFALNALASPKAVSTNSIIYTMADLEVLFDSNSYEDFFRHYKDIRPSERNEEWQKLVLLMAQNWAKDLKATGPYTLRTLEKIDQVRKIKFLKSDEVFSIYLNQFAIMTFRQCFNSIQSNKCPSAAYNYWVNSNGEQELGLKLGQMILDHQNKLSPKDLLAFNNELKKIDIWSFFKSSYESSFADRYCADPVMKSVLIQKFYELMEQDEKINFYYFNRKCLSTIKNDLEQLLFSHNELEREMAFKVFVDTNELKDQQKDLYYLAYLLDKPNNKNKLKLAWSHIEALKRSATRRDHLMSVLKENTNFSYSLLNTKNTKLITSVLFMLSESFPEIIDHLSKQCLTGKAGYNCHQFVEIAQDKNWLNPVYEQKLNTLLSSPQRD